MSNVKIVFLKEYYNDILFSRACLWKGQSYRLKGIICLCLILTTVGLAVLKHRFQSSLLNLPRPPPPEILQQ